MDGKLFLARLKSGLQRVAAGVGFLHRETRFILGNNDYVRSQLQVTYELVLKAQLTSKKDQKIKYLLAAIGNIQETLKLLGVEDWRQAIQNLNHEQSETPRANKTATRRKDGQNPHPTP